MPRLNLSNIVLSVIALSLSLSVTTICAAQITQISLTNSGGQPNDDCGLSTSSVVPNIMSANNRFVVFESAATLIVSDDRNENANSYDIFLRDTVLNTTTLVSRNSNNEIFNNQSRRPSISGDGTIVAFDSWADNHGYPDSATVKKDVFVRNLATGITEKISKTPNGSSPDNTSGAPSLGYSGRFVAFASAATNLVPGDTEGYQDIFLYDRALNVMERVSAVNGVGGNGNSIACVISADERFVAFYTYATNLVPGEQIEDDLPTTNYYDMFVFDRITKQIERVSVGIGGTEPDGQSGANGISINADGRFIAFTSTATNLVSSDTNGTTDIFVYDRELNTTQRVSLDSSGNQLNAGTTLPSINANGNLVAFASDGAFATDTYDIGAFDVFVRNIKNGTTFLASTGEARSASIPNMSSNGEFVLYNATRDGYVFQEYWQDTGANNDVCQ